MSNELTSTKTQAETIPAPPKGFVLKTTDDMLRRNCGAKLADWASEADKKRHADLHK